MAGRKLPVNLPTSLSRYIASRALPFSRARSLPLHLRPPVAAAASIAEGRFGSAPSARLRCFSTRPTTSSLNDPSPNWNNRPPKETILLDGCDFEHWLVVVEPPDPAWTRDEIINSYIKTLAQVLGSDEEARMSIYSVSTKHYFAFGCKVSEEISYKIKPLPNVRWVLPDSYLDVKNKDYGGEPFIDGKEVPYDPKYHEEWVRNRINAEQRSRRNIKPRNFDRSRIFERRQENMQNFQNREAPSAPNQGFQNPMPPRDGPPPSNPPPNYQNQMPNQQSNYTQPNPAPGYQANNQGYQGGPGYQGGQRYQGGGGYPGGNMPGGPAQGGQGYQGGGAHPGGNMPGGPAQGGQGYTRGGGHPGGNMPGDHAYQGPSPGNYQSGGPGPQGGGPSYRGHNAGYQGNSPPYQGGFSGYQPSNSGYQGSPPNYQQGAPSYQGGTSPYPGRDVPGRD